MASETSACVESGRSILILPNNPPDHSYLGKPPNLDALALSRRWVLRLDMHEIVLSAAFAAHLAPHQLSLNVPEDLP
ncbi:hypothetical protein [Mesorhizobium sp.]|uniref:hypothetical protein n=1 Tax=Mesorhizobium sp. TaxID=1871066 RepID=UPI00257F4395|nr:hypothetical protein [Mesorhizobium sp.]